MMMAMCSLEKAIDSFSRALNGRIYPKYLSLCNFRWFAIRPGESQKHALFKGFFSLEGKAVIIFYICLCVYIFTIQASFMTQELFSLRGQADHLHRHLTILTVLRWNLGLGFLACFHLRASRKVDRRRFLMRI